IGRLSRLDRRVRAQRSGRRPRSADHPDEVRRVAHPLAPAGRLGVDRDLAPGVADADAAAGDPDLDALADPPPRRGIAVGVEFDCAIGLDLALELANLPERRPAVERAKRSRFVAPEPIDRRLFRRAVIARVGDLAHPPRKVSLERRPGVEAMAGDRVALPVADAALVLA